MLRGGILQHSYVVSNRPLHSKYTVNSYIKCLPGNRRSGTRLSIHAEVANLRFRKARKDDTPIIRRMIFQER